MSAARVWAQAKLNLLLRVLAREVGGFHSIETLMLRLDVGDDVVVRPLAHETTRSIDCRGADVGPAEQNLAYRAARAYQDATGWPPGFSIEIEKHIPVGGGLGGGSADAGAVLRALDSLSPRPLGRRLIDLAAQLGSDVAFLTIEQPMALAWSRGERLLTLAPLPSRAVALIFPPFGVSARDAYTWISETRGGFLPHGSALSVDELRNWDAVAALAVNDLEPVVIAHHPSLSEPLEQLKQHGALFSMMSGSGSTMFGVFSEKPSSNALANASRARVLVTRTAERVVRVERTE